MHARWDIAQSSIKSATLRILNLVVGNEECAAGIEISVGRVQLQFAGDALMAWDGADSDVRFGTLRIPRLRCARILAGAVAEIRPGRGQ